MLDDEYIRASRPEGFDDNGNLDLDILRSRTLEWIMHLPHDSSPGLPLCTVYKENSEIIDIKDFVSNCVIERLSLLLKINFTESAQELVASGSCDPWRLFIKNEPHSELKISTGRLRLIWNGSIIDQLIDRLLFNKQNKLEIANWLHIPSKPGMGFSDEDCNNLYAEVEKTIGISNMLSIDVSGWDFSFQELFYDLDCERRIKFMKATGNLERLIRARFYCLKYKVVTFSDGVMYEQVIAGIMASGWFNTSSSNSYGANCMARIAEAKQSFSNGDDALADRYVKKEIYEKFGFTTKLFLESTADTFEFCSTIYDGSRYHPSSPWRTFFRLCAQSKPLEFLDQFVFDMRGHPMTQKLVGFVMSAGGADKN